TLGYLFFARMGDSRGQAMPKTCPNCGKDCFSDWSTCNCGYSFEAGAMKQTHADFSKRGMLRWLISLAALGLGVFFVYQWPDVVIKGTPIPYGSFIILFGGVGVFGCTFGINVFKGGPLDMDNDPSPNKGNNGDPSLNC